MNQWAKCCGVPESEKVRFDKEDEELDQRERERFEIQSYAQGMTLYRT